MRRAAVAFLPFRPRFPVIRFRCPQCNQEIKADESLAGRKGACPRCGEAVVLPLPDNDPILHHANVARKLPEELIDMTAMVDIVFFILIFFMVTSFNSKQASIDLPIPRATAADAQQDASARSLDDYEEDDDYFIVRVDADGTLWLDGAQVAGNPELARRLRDELRPADAPRRLLLVAEADAPYGAVVEALDTAREVGLDELRISVVEEEA